MNFISDYLRQIKSLFFMSLLILIIYICVNYLNCVLLLNYYLFDVVLIFFINQLIFCVSFFLKKRLLRSYPQFFLSTSLKKDTASFFSQKRKKFLRKVIKRLTKKKIKWRLKSYSKKLSRKFKKEVKKRILLKIFNNLRKKKNRIKRIMLVKKRKIFKIFKRRKKNHIKRVIFYKEKKKKRKKEKRRIVLGKGVILKKSRKGILKLLIFFKKRNLLKFLIKRRQLQLKTSVSKNIFFKKNVYLKNKKNIKKSKKLYKKSKIIKRGIIKKTVKKKKKPLKKIKIIKKKKKSLKIIFFNKFQRKSYLKYFSNKVKIFFLTRKKKKIFALLKNNIFKLSKKKRGFDRLKIKNNKLKLLRLLKFFKKIRKIMLKRTILKKKGGLILLRLKNNEHLIKLFDKIRKNNLKKKNTFGKLFESKIIKFSFLYKKNLIILRKKYQIKIRKFERLKKKIVKKYKRKKKFKNFELNYNNSGQLDLNTINWLKVFSFLKRKNF